MLDNILLVYELENSWPVTGLYWEFNSGLGQLKLYTKIITIIVIV